MLAIYYRDLFELLNIRLQCKSYNFRICGALNYFNNFSSSFQRLFAKRN